MVAAFLLLVFSAAQAQAPSAPIPQQQSVATGASSPINSELAGKLVKVKRVYVDSFGDDAISKQLQAMVITALASSNRFILTENKDKADAILKGTGLEKTSQEFHAIGDSTTVAAAGGGEHSEISGSNGSVSGSSGGGFFGKKMGTSDSQASTETVNDARLAVRLVYTDGDVLWTTTKESKGAKYKGASADVADQIVKQLLSDLDKATNDTKH